jgi:hypothetical protein
MQDIQNLRTRALLQGATALGLLVLFTAGMLLRWGPCADWYYPLAWWPFILVLDAFVMLRQGHSILSRSPREFLFLSVLSVPVWLFFEAYNLAIQNWYYAGSDPIWWARWVGYSVCFATVLPAIFEATELAGALGFFREVRVRPIRVSPGLRICLVCLGVVCFVLPLLAPRYTFPLVWLGGAFLLEPFNYKWGTGSLLRDWERGSMGRLLRLLVGGVICGLAWEAFNIQALCKWVYTVPYFEGLKLFEMPLAGFLGFPPFAVECYAIVEFVKIFRGTKERGTPPVSLPAAARWAILVLVSAGSLWMFHLLDRYTVNSLIPRVGDLEPLAPQEASLLRGAGIERLDLWVMRSEDGDKSEAAARTRLELPTQSTERWKGWAVMATLKGMGTENLRLLLEAGIRSPGELARQEPQALGSRLRAIQERRGWARQPPRDAQVRVWVREARRVCEGRGVAAGLGCQ